MAALKMCGVVLCAHTGMYKKGRLSVHRKNEFRKRRAEKRGICTVTVSHSFPISIPTAEVSLFRISLPKEYFFNVRLKTLDSLKEKIKSNFILPEGLYYYMASYMFFTSYVFEGWNYSSSLCNEFCVVKVENKSIGEPEVQKSLSVHTNFSWQITVKGHILKSDSDVFSTLSQSIDSLSSLNQVLSFVNECAICSGNDDASFRTFLTNKENNFTDISGECIFNHVIVYVYVLSVLGKKQLAFYDDQNQTIRSTNCVYLLSAQQQTKVNQCHNCSRYRQTLSRMLYRIEHQESKETDKTDPSSHTNYRFLSSKEKSERLKNLHDQARVMQQNINRLRDQINKQIDEKGTEVEDDLDEALGAIVKEKSPFVACNYEEGSFPRIFWEAQQKAATLKSLKSMRWHPLMIRWCLYLRHLSGSAYETIRESGVIKLPSQRTLRDYTYYTKATVGFSADVDEQISKAAKIESCPERQKYVIILMDEMHIKEGLVYDKHTG